MSFESDTKVQGKSLYTTVDDFKEIYKDFGYDPNDEHISFYKADDNNDNAIQGGLSYIVRPGNGYAYLMIDSEMYTKDVNGQSENRGTGKGMISESLKAWILQQIAQCNASGETVIAAMHHPLLVHNTTSETAFITDVVSNNEALVKEFADAGLRYVFTGHMHENDVATYTTSKGNTLYDMETGGMVSYGSPIRSVKATKQGVREKLEISSTSVKEAAMNAQLDGPNGNIINTEKVDVLQYEENLLYSDIFLQKFIHRYANGYLNQLDDIPNALKNIANLDLYDTLFKALPGLLKNEMSVDLSGVGKLKITYSSSYSSTGQIDTGESDGVHLKPEGAAALLLKNYTVRDADIKTEVQSVLDQIEENYVRNGELNNRIDAVINKIGNVELAQGHTLNELLRAMFELHNLGVDSTDKDSWIQESIDLLAKGNIIKDKINDVIENDIKKLISDVLDGTTINLKTLFGRDNTWLTTVTAYLGDGETPRLSTVLSKFNVNVNGLLDGLINQYLSDSFYTSVGGLVKNMINGFITDDSQDDVVNGNSLTIEYDGELHPNNTIENGMLPNQVTVSLGDSASKRNLSWYTGTEVNSGEVQFVKADAGMTAENAFNDTNAITRVNAAMSEENKAKLKLNLILVTTYDITKAHRYQATIDLQEGCDYYYRVGNADNNLWSEPVLLKQRTEENGFTFINVADSQGATEDDYKHFNDVLAQAEKKFNNASFITHLGDMVDDGNNENYWTWLLNTEEMQTLPVLPVAGNHEARATNDQLMNAIEAHYNLNVPEQDKSNGLYYSFVYQDATFIVLNTNDLNGNDELSENQMKWAEETAKNATTKWKILLTHKAPYSMGPHKNDNDVSHIRNQLNKYTADYGIDLVLSGHDHTYMRSSYLCDGVKQDVETNTIVRDGITYQAAVNPTGTAFVIPSTSGVKYYELNEDQSLPYEKYGQPYQSIYTGITIEGDELYYNAYTEDGNLYDSFAIMKKDVEPDLAQNVIDMIDALPKQITLANKDDVVAARNAYNALSDEDKARVTNLSVLESAEAMINALENMASGEAVVTNKDEFLNALRNSDIGTIKVQGKIVVGKYNSPLNGNVSDVWQGVNRNLVIKGISDDAELNFLGLIVDNNATLVLDDILLYTNHSTLHQGNGHLTNLIELNSGTVITQGRTTLYLGTLGKCDNDNNQHGHDISLKGTGKVYLNATGDVYSKRDNIYSYNDRGTDIVVNNGKLSTSENCSIDINENSSLTVNGGTITSIKVKNLNMNGGTIGEGNDGGYPVELRGGTAYLAGGNIVKDPSNGRESSGKIMKVEDGGKVYYNAGKSGLTVDGVDLGMKSISTTNNKNLSIDVSNLGTSGQGNVYALDNRNLTTLQLLANNENGKLDTNYQDNTLSTVLTQTGVNYVYTKYKVTNGSLYDVMNMAGNNEVWAISPLSTINNVAVSTVQLKADVTSVQAGKTLQIQSRTMPNTAIDNQLTWRVEGDSATVDQNGLVTGVKSGTVKVIATAPSGVQGEITIRVVDGSIEGATQIDAQTFTSDYTLSGVDGYELRSGVDGYELRWNLSQNDENSISGWQDDNGNYQIVRRDYKGGNVVLTVSLYENGKDTGIAFKKDITVLENTSIKAVIAGINDLPAEITIDDKEVISQLLQQYNALTDTEKKFVTNYSILENATNKLEELENQDKANQVIEKINAIGEVTSLEDAAKVEEAREAYDTLTETQKALVTNLETLTQAEEKIAELQTEKENQDKANQVIEKINAIGEVTSLEDAVKVEEARKAYDALTETQKVLVTNYQTLEAAEKKLVELQKEANAKVVIEAIDNLPNPITLEDQAVVAAINEAYNGLSDDEKALVTNYQILQKAQLTLAQLNAQNELGAMKEINGYLYTTESYQTLVDAMNKVALAINGDDIEKITLELENMHKAYDTLIKKSDYIETLDKDVTLDKDLLNQVIENQGKIELHVGDKVNNVILSKDALSSIDDKVEIVIYTGDGVGYVWTVSNSLSKDLNLVIHKTDIKDHSEAVLQDKNGFVVEFENGDDLSGQASVRIYVGDKFKAADKVMVSCFDGKQLTNGKAYIVDNDGYITIDKKYAMYVIEEIKENNPSNPSNPSVSDKTPNLPGDNLDQNQTETSENKPNHSVETGDAANIGLFLMMALGSMTVLLRKRED